MNIRNKKDLELAYILIKDSKLAKMPALAELKRDVRRYTHRENGRRVIQDDGIDGGTLLIKLPDDIETAEDAEMWFLENEYRECRPSAYDCTGQLFTSSFKLVERFGRWFCYHTVRFDV